MTKRILALLLCCCMVLSLAACGSQTEAKMPTTQGPADVAAAVTTPPPSSTVEGGPATILPKLQNAYNNQDLYGMIECFDPTATRAVFGVAKLLGFEESDTIREILPFFSKALGASGALDNSSWGTVALTALSYDVSGTEATLTYNVSMSKNDSSDSFDETMKCVMVDDVWYISAIQPVSIAADSQIPPIPVTAGVTEADVKELYTFKENGEIGLLNESAKVIIAPFFEDVGDLSLEYIPVKKAGHWGIIDRQGMIVLDFRFQDIVVSDGCVENDGYYIVQHDDKWGLYSPSTGKAVECKYQSVSAESGHGKGDGYYQVEFGDKWGLYNPTTGMEIECKYDHVGEMSGGVAPACLDGFWGLIDKNGNVTVDFIYDSVSGGNNMGAMLAHGMIGVCYNGNWGVIDGNGNYIVPLGDIKKEPYIYGIDTSRRNGNIEKIEKDYIVVTLEKYDFATTRYGPTNVIYDLTSKTYIDIDESYRIFDIQKNSFGSTRTIRFIGRLGDNYVYTIHGTNTMDDRNNILLIDSEGNVVRSLMDELDAPDGMIVGEWLVDGKLLQLRNYKYGLAVYGETVGNYNILTSSGTYLLDNWTTITPKKIDDIIFAYDSIGNSSAIFDLEGNLLCKRDGKYSWSDSHGIMARLGKKEIEYINFLTGEEKTFENDAESCDVYGASEQCCVFFNGVSYGLFVGVGDGGFVGSGMDYHNIEYDKDSDIFTLTLGAKKEHYRIGRDGTIVKLP